MGKFSTTDLALMFSALDFVLIHLTGEQTEGVGDETLTRIREYLDKEAVGPVESAQDLAKRIAEELEEAIS